MAQRTLVQLIDDIDGTTVANGKGETIEFGIDGVLYEIDLADKNAKRFRDALAPFVGSARKVSARGARRVSGGRSARADKAQTQAIREWAKENGYEISDRGRIPATIIEAYNAE
ncbi:histone-like nucleoid-structuring protein Lsr2 [Tenggerimyces flavus]|uniref:Lsr2 family protein n=1 Tax=Tenggerimyces flavus TaxID=1708749 RepID=A0ABV7YF92_9ACTN|nr:Lsr2 family protein [Tenggerimyces flavus]MBM7786807.1 hypothetical protein [Tenggerimyces flavus]